MPYRAARQSKGQDNASLARQSPIGRQDKINGKTGKTGRTQKAKLKIVRSEELGVKSKKNAKLKIKDHLPKSCKIIEETYN